MKKLILFAAILFAGVSVVKAQAVNDKTELKVTLNNIQSIIVEDNVSLVYETQEDYEEGVTLNKPNHLKIFSVGDYVVNVKSKETVLSGGGEKDIPVNLFKIGMPGVEEGEVIAGAKILSEGGEDLFSGTTHGLQAFPIVYQGSGGNKLIPYFDTAEGVSNIYTVDVVYTITPQ